MVIESLTLKYRFALDRLDAKPHECIFIDDYPSRVDTASELGIISILFDRDEHDYSGLRIKSFKQREHSSY